MVIEKPWMSIYLHDKKTAWAERNHVCTEHEKNLKLNAIVIKRNHKLNGLGKDALIWMRVNETEIIFTKIDRENFFLKMFQGNLVTYAL